MKNNKFAFLTEDFGNFSLSGEIGNSSYVKLKNGGKCSLDVLFEPTAGRKAVIKAIYLGNDASILYEQLEGQIGGRIQLTGDISVDSYGEMILLAKRISMISEFGAGDLGALGNATQTGTQSQETNSCPSNSERAENAEVPAQPAAKTEKVAEVVSKKEIAQEKKEVALKPVEIEEQPQAEEIAPVVEGHENIESTEQEPEVAQEDSVETLAVEESISEDMIDDDDELPNPVFEGDEAPQVDGEEFFNQVKPIDPKALKEPPKQSKQEPEESPKQDLGEGQKKSEKPKRRVVSVL